MLRKNCTSCILQYELYDHSSKVIITETCGYSPVCITQPNIPTTYAKRDYYYCIFRLVISTIVIAYSKYHVMSTRNQSQNLLEKKNIAMKIPIKIETRNVVPKSGK